MKAVGMIGLGTMGGPMAANLLAQGFSVTVYNRTPGKTDELRELGADVAQSPMTVAKASDVVITMVSNDQAIEDVYYGSEGVLKGIKPGSTVIDCSTISPSLVKRIAADVAGRYADFLDAPVTGSKPAAIDGTLVFMVGGKAEAMEEHRDVFEAMGRKLLHMGDNGSGATAKLAHNTIVGINAAGLAEGMALAAAGGIRAASFLELVQSGGAASKQAELKGGKIIEGDYSVQFSLALMLKDLRLSSVLSDGLGVATPMLEASKSLFQLGLAAGYGEQDLAALARLYEQWIGRRIGESAAAALKVAALPADGLDASAGAGSGTAKPDADEPERRRSTRLALQIPVMMSIYEWEREGSFSGQAIEGYLLDLSDNGLQVASTFPLAKDMFVVIHYQEDSGLPPMTARIIRIERHEGDVFHYGCMLSGLPPYQRLELEQYIESKLAE